MNRPLIKQETRFINNNVLLQNNYRYAFNSSGDFIIPMGSGAMSTAASLLSMHYLQPIETSTQKQQGSSTTFIEGAHYGFGSFSVYPNTYTYPNLVRHYTTLSDSADWNISAYDSLGNIAEQYRTGDVHTVWLWGYYYTYPVAKIVGSDFSTCMSFVSNAVLQHPSSDAALRTEINKIRTGLASNGTQVTTYTYSPLVGMTSQVDPAGRIIYYEYDSHGRLTTIRDQNNNILKKYSYTLNNP
jgi:YD repeat-containing protein